MRPREDPLLHPGKLGAAQAPALGRSLGEPCGERPQAARFPDPGPFFRMAPEPALVLDADGRVSAANAAFLSALCEPSQEVEGASVSDLTREADASALLAALRDPGAGACVEAALRMPDGTLREIAWHLSEGPQGMRFAILRDVTEERRDRRHRDAIERITGVGSWESEPGGLRSFFSPVVWALYGTDPAAMTREERMDFYQPGGRQRFARAMTRLEADGTPFDIEAAFHDAEGRLRWVRVTGDAVMREARVERIHGTMRDVTEERHGRVLLERLSAVARLTTNAVMVTDGQARIEWVNDAFTAQTGYAAEDVIGRVASMLDSPRNNPAVLRALKAALTEGRPCRAEILNLHRDGREIRVEVDLQPLLDPDGGRLSWIAVRTDVTRRRATEAQLARAEREARASREQLLTAVEVLGDGFVLYDARDRMVVCNERYRELYAASAHAMEPGTTFEAILRAGLANGQYLDALGREEAWLAQRLADHRAVDRSVEQALPDDRWLRVVERATPDGGRVGLRVDITELKRQSRAIDEARRRAEAANAAKSAFLATMSHEIRTPMNGILGLVDLLAETAVGEEQRRTLDDIRDSGEGLLTILNDVLDFSKIEAGRMTLEAMGFRPEELGSRAEALHAPLARDKGLELRVEVEGGPPRLGDPTRLMQVLGNLLSNALKFTERGEVRLEIRNPSDGPLVLRVADTGIGMSAEEASTVFERFSQADSSVTRRFGGTGLGLSIVQGLVEAMGGRVDVRSAPGQGTRIELTLPLPIADAAASAAPAEPMGDLAGLRILAADDNRTNRRVLSRLLDRLRASATVVASGAEAVAAAREGAFDLLLLDIAMPEMDGVEALARIRADEREAGLPPVPALAVTANVLDDQVADYLSRGFAGHMAKPVRLAALARESRSALEDPAPEEPAPEGFTPEGCARSCPAEDLRSPGGRPAVAASCAPMPSMGPRGD